MMALFGLAAAAVLGRRRSGRKGAKGRVEA
jgi:hypothetical protein